MDRPGTVFVSYSHDSPAHARAVLSLSDKLRSEGVDCVLDQYETTPPEGWPRWMDREIRRAEFVLVICTETYHKRVMGEEEAGRGLGIKWEGSLIYQHLYDAESLNTKFIPVLLNREDRKYIPTPLRGATHYIVEAKAGYDALYSRLLRVPQAQRPQLGKRRAVPKREVKTDVAMFVSLFIDPEVWDEAGWRGMFFIGEPGTIPILGLGYKKEEPAKRIFQYWRERLGANDRYEELRIAIIEGHIDGVDPGYSVHIGADLDNVAKRYKTLGFRIGQDAQLSINRIHRMDVGAVSPHLEMFKSLYRQYKSYLVVPGLLDVERQQIKPFIDLGIHKGTIYFRDVGEIRKNDIDWLVVDGAHLQ